ncbi:MAG TPA: cell envelope integrity protein CreD [Chryseosolibacter sp.]
METIDTPSQTILERFNEWIQESIMVKLFSIGFLILILLIPTAWIDDLIYERQQRADEVIQEVADKWSASQKISGPILVIPFLKEDIINHSNDGKEVRHKLEKAFFLPENLDITGEVSPETLHRGIFDAVVYQSSLKINATFAKPDVTFIPTSEANILWKDAYMIFGISDLRGISDNPAFVSGDTALTAEPSNNIGVRTRNEQLETFSQPYNDAPASSTLSSNGIITKLNWAGPESFQGRLNVKLNLKGSRRLDFVPTGKTTTVNLSGNWPDPSFDGEFLPVKREITESSFAATWKVLHFNRPFSQHWTESNQALSGADFGLKLLVPVDQYQKSIRTSKYGVLIILLTFMALFLVEITQKIRIHPFQYILIGAALIIYYTLLLSFSEHVGYNIAYIIASVATVILISLYSTTFFPSNKLAILFSILLAVFYAFIYVIILQQDFSLLLGSVGLFLIIGTLMYFSRKVKWYKDDRLKQSV